MVYVCPSTAEQKTQRFSSYALYGHPDPHFQNSLVLKCIAFTASRRGTPDRRRGTSDLVFGRWAVGVLQQKVGRVRQSIEFIDLLKESMVS